MFSVVKKLFAQTYPFWPSSSPPPHHVIFDPFHAFEMGKAKQKKISLEGKLLSTQDFSKQVGIIYCPKLIFRSYWTYLSITSRCQLMKRRGWIDHERFFLGALNLNALTNSYCAPMDIRWIDDEIGYGAFAAEDLETHAFIGEYTGLIYEKGLIFPYSTPYSFAYPTACSFTVSHLIDASKFGNETRFINHSDAPNCESFSVFSEGLFHMIFRSHKKVKKGEELTYNYGDDYWRFRKKRIEGYS